jgi:hypothetical protein
MKLTKSTIIQLIKEEIQSTLKEASWRVRGRLRKKVNAACFKGGVVTKRGIRKLKSGGCPQDPNITYEDFGLARKAAHRGDAAEVNKLLNKLPTRQVTGGGKGPPAQEYPYPGTGGIPEQKPLVSGVDQAIVAKIAELDEMIKFLRKLVVGFEGFRGKESTIAGTQEHPIQKNPAKAKKARQTLHSLLVGRSKIVGRANATAGKEVQADLLPEIDRLLKSYEAQARAGS